MLPGSWSDPEQHDDNMAPAMHSPSGQGHDRLGHDGSVALAAAKTSGGAGKGIGGDDFEITAAQKMASAMSGSLLTSLLVTPLDVVRVRLQSQNAFVPAPKVDLSRLAHATTPSFAQLQTSELGVTACCREVFWAGNQAEFCLATPKIEGMSTGGAVAADCAVQETRKKTFTTTFDGLRKIARNEGVTTLWRGLSPTLVMTIPANIIYFTGYEWLRYDHRSPFSKLSDDYAPLTAGSGARILAASAVSPIELIRTRMQAASGSKSNHLMEAFRDVKEMVALHGYASMWRGLTLTLWRDVPFSGLYWWGYETIRGRLSDAREERTARALFRTGPPPERRRRSRSRENHTDTFVDSFTAGAMSGAFASVVTTPFDVGKTRTQVYREPAPSGGVRGSASAEAPEARNMLRLLWHIFKTEGVPGLWKGWIPRTLKVAPACAIMISSYEVGKRVFHGVNDSGSEISARHSKGNAAWASSVMYTLSNVETCRFGRGEYVLDVRRTAAGLAATSSDQMLSLLDPARLTPGPVNSLPVRHGGGVAALRVFDWAGSLVCTAGDDGSVAVWDLRQGAAKAEVARFTGEWALYLLPAEGVRNEMMRSHWLYYEFTVLMSLTEDEYSQPNTNLITGMRLGDVRSTPAPKAHYQEVHSDDITDLSFHAGNPALLMSGSTDGLVNVCDTRVADEDDVVLQTFNHNASIHHAAFLHPSRVLALSHDEQFALYDMADENPTGDALVHFGDLREKLGCQYVASVSPKADGSGAVLGAGSQDQQMFELVFLADAQGSWALDRQNSVGLPGAHGDEIVRAFCFFDEEQVVYTAGEDGTVKAWRPGS
ncbi:Mitochondrial carrier protein [Paramyrothecium foliicola]|nr:Mitochondrial carrier protein [Paramyrothecium foliicola]